MIATSKVAILEKIKRYPVTFNSLCIYVEMVTVTKLVFFVTTRGSLQINKYKLRININSVDLFSSNFTTKFTSEQYSIIT